MTAWHVPLPELTRVQTIPVRHKSTGHAPPTPNIFQ